MPASATPRLARRIAVACLGATVLLLGIALLVLPGPAFVVIPVGLAILATEFVWAQRLLRKTKQIARGTLDAARHGRRGRSPHRP